MTVLITLSGVGSSAGPTFNLYASPDGITFTTIIEGINKTVLEAGYTATVPDGTTDIKVTSVGACTNSYVATIGVIPTTTTTTTAAPTTTTTTTLTCLGYTISSNNPLSSATVNFIECNGDSSSLSVGFGTGYDSLPFCAKNGQYTVVGDGSVNYTGSCIYTYLLSSPGKSSRILACAETTFPLTVYSDTFPIVDSTILYTNNTGGVLSTPVVGANLWHQSFIDTLTFQIGNDGVVSNASLCV